MTPKKFLEVVIGNRYVFVHPEKNFASATSGFWFATVREEDGKLRVNLEYTGRVKGRMIFIQEDLTDGLVETILKIKTIMEQATA